MASVGASGLLILAGCSNSDSHSPSYKRGYDMMTTNSRETIAEVNDQLSSEGKPRSDSPAALFGSSGERIPHVCQTTLNMATVGSANGNGPKLPDPFSSTDFLSGCSDAGKALLSESQPGGTPSSTVPRARSQVTPTPPTALLTPRSDVRVYNDSMQRGLASAAADRLKAGGFNVTDIGNLVLPRVTVTTVYFGTTPGERDSADAVGQLLGAPVEPRIPEIAEQPPGVIVVVTAER